MLPVMETSMSLVGLIGRPWNLRDPIQATAKKIRVRRPSADCVEGTTPNRNRCRLSRGREGGGVGAHVLRTYAVQDFTRCWKAHRICAIKSPIATNGDGRMCAISDGVSSSMHKTPGVQSVRPRKPSSLQPRKASGLVVLPLKPLQCYRRYAIQWSVVQRRGAWHS